MKTITVWELGFKQKDGSFQWEHNHIEDGFDEAQTEPKPTTTHQEKSWKNGTWRKFKAVLNGIDVQLTKE